MTKAENPSSLDKSALIELSNEIQVAGVEEKSLNPDQKTVVETLRKFVGFVVTGNNLQDNFIMAKCVREVQEGTKIITGAYNWMKTFYPEMDSYYLSENLSVEMVEVTRHDQEKMITEFNSLSSVFRLEGLSEREMNEQGVDNKKRVSLLQEALVGGKLSIAYHDERLLQTGSGFGPVITGKKL